MSIVNNFYQENRDFSENDLLNAIINTSELTPEDLWLLPQYVFDEWRKKHDYPRILDNFKRRLKRFEENTIENYKSQLIYFLKFLISINQKI